MKTELIYCPKCHKFERAQVVPRGYRCLECGLVYSKLDSEVSLEEKVKEAVK